MRLRHKKNAEIDILSSPKLINIYSDDVNITKKKYSVESLHRIFNNNNEIHLELGMGKGKFIYELSKINKDINYIGIEKSATIVLKAIDKFEKDNLENNTHNTNDNLKFMCLDIANILNVFEENSIDKIYLNFSDPWPKKHHETRRLTSHIFLEKFSKVLKDGCLIEFKTDNKGLFDFSMEEIKKTNFKLISHTYDLHNDSSLNANNIMTEYEEKFSKLGNKICKFIIENNK